MRLFILGICLSFSLSAAEPYFVEAIDFSKSLELSQVLHSIQVIAKKPKHLISLGESHLHPVTARAVQEIFIKQYLDVAQDFRFCSEEINDFLARDAGQMLLQQASESEISKGNSPSRTDFRNCRTSDFKRYFTYSGFFHQLPFARPFPLDFTPFPVVTEQGENIRDQMKESNSYFIIQMELEYVEMITQAHLLRHPPTKPKEFREKVSALISIIEQAKKNQGILIESSLPQRQKVGVFLGPQAFPVLPLEATLLITDLSYRKKLMPLPLVRAISALDDEALVPLLNILAKSPAYVTGAIQEPDENGKLSETGYGTIPWLFPANSTFLEIRVVAGENVLLSADPASSQLGCVAYKKLGPSRVDCEDYLRNLP